MKLSTLATALLAMASTTYAHMTLAKPSPYGAPDNSPLKPDGTDFPCKNVAYTVNEMNDFVAGKNSSFLWQGSAVHAGGSCLVVLTTDKEPSKDSKFKVLHAVEGGCPGTAETGPQEFSFMVPKEVPNGDHAVAVVWWNKIGNREMYMNCAPVQVTGGSDDTAAFEKLPDLPIANINVGGASCKTPEGVDYTFEIPDRLKTRVGTGLFKDLCGGEASGGPSVGSPSAPQSAAGNPNNGQYTPPASQAPSAQVPSSQAPVISKTSHSPTNSVPVVVTSTTSTLVTVTITGSSPSAPAAVSTAAPQSSQTPTASDGKATCPTDGAILCNGPTQFGICDHGKVVWQTTSSGTTCENGAISKRGYSRRAQRSVGRNH